MKKEILILKISKEDKDLLKKKAADYGLSMSAFIRLMITRPEILNADKIRT